MRQTINISLPEDMRAYVEGRVASGEYGSTSEYVRELIRQEQRRQQKELLDRKLIEAVESLDQGKGVELTREYLDRLYDRVMRARKRRAKG